MTNLVISNQAISQHNDFYSLNDLHRASGAEKKHQPALFFRNAEVQELISEIERSTNLQNGEKAVAYHTKQGKQGGTYACRELVYRYAMWISPKFSLMVIRAFDALNTGAIPCLDKPKLTDNQAYQIQKAIKQKCLNNKVHYQTIYHALYDEFGVKSYKDILASEFENAMAFIESFEFAVNLNLAFIQDVLKNSAHQNTKARQELDHIINTTKHLIYHIEELQVRLGISERCVHALHQRLV